MLDHKPDVKHMPGVNNRYTMKHYLKVSLRDVEACMHLCYSHTHGYVQNQMRTQQWQHAEIIYGAYTHAQHLARMKPHTRT